MSASVPILTLKKTYTVCAIRVSFVCRVPREKQSVKFHNCFDVIRGQLLFLIGPPSPLTTKRTLYCPYSNLSIIIHWVIYCLQLEKQLSHLELRLAWIVSHLRSLWVVATSRTMLRITAWTTLLSKTQRTATTPQLPTQLRTHVEA